MRDDEILRVAQLAAEQAAGHYIIDEHAAALVAYARARKWPTEETLARKLGELNGRGFPWARYADAPEPLREGLAVFRAVALALEPGRDKAPRDERLRAKKDRTEEMRQARGVRLQGGEAFHGVATDPGVAVATLGIVAEEQVDLVAQIHTALDEDRDVVRCEHPAVLDLGAPGIGGEPQRVGPMQVNDRPQPLSARLPTGGLELGSRQRGDTTEPDARRGEDLDDVCALRRAVAHICSDLVRGAGALVYRSER